MTVLDISNHDYSTFSAPCFEERGVERVIVGCWIREQTEDMVRRCRAVGIAAEDLYCYLYYGLPHERREVDYALDIAREIGGIKRIWLDCEADPPHELAGISPGQRIARTMAAATMVRAAGIEAGIYTYGPYWRAKMANSPAFSNLKLWWANYGMNNPNNPLPPVQAVNFGGWTKASAHQYSSTIPVCGRGRDHNYWFIESEGDAMTPAERAEFDELKQTVSDLANIVVRNGIDTDGDGKVDMNGDAALAHAIAKGWSAFLSASDANRKIAAHSEHAGQVTDAWSGTGTFTGTFTPEGSE